MTLLVHELKRNLKSLLIWTLSVGILCGGCLLLFESLEEYMAEMAEAYSSMGAFSEALGMDKMNIGTIEGFYATEIGLMFALGGAMFAAMTGAAIVSKEEEGHTSEFLNTLPLGRGYIAGWKYVALVVLILLFQVICLIFVGIGFAGAGEWPPFREFALFHGTQILMQLEIGSICFLISAVSKRRQIGGALGLAMLLYMIDLLSRVLPDLENLKYVTPYYFSNAAEIVATVEIPMDMLLISVLVTTGSAAAAVIIYKKRDLSA